MLGHLCHFFVPFLVLFSLYTSFQYVFLIDWKDLNQYFCESKWRREWGSQKIEHKKSYCFYIMLK